MSRANSPVAPEGGLRNFSKRTRDEIAARAASDIPEGWYVDLGIGIPTVLQTTSTGIGKSFSNRRMDCWASGRPPHPRPLIRG